MSKKKTFRDVWSGLSAQEKRDLSVRAELTYQTISDIAGGRKSPSLAAAKRLSEARRDIHIGMF